MNTRFPLRFSQPILAAILYVILALLMGFVIHVAAYNREQILYYYFVW